MIRKRRLPWKAETLLVLFGNLKRKRKGRRKKSQ